MPWNFAFFQQFLIKFLDRLLQLLEEIRNEICFLEGTLIETVNGPRPIEELEPGDLIVTTEGPLPCRFVSKGGNHPSILEATDQLPICIKAGALGAGLPQRDLYLTGNHALLLDGHLVHASALINGTTISQTTAEDWASKEKLAYYNVELERHAVIHAENLPVESFVDNQPRSEWDNYEEYMALYGADEPIQEMELPRIRFARQIPATLRLFLQQRGLVPAMREGEKKLVSV